MTIFNDENRTVEIVITTWDEAIGQWSADWSEYFYDAVAKDVKDVQYYIDQATDMRDGKGDYADGDPHPDVAVTVTELDHDDYMRGHMVRASDPADPTSIAMNVLDGGGVVSGTTMTMEGVNALWERTVTRGDDLYTARPVENNPSRCEIGRFTRHEWRDGDGGVLETWDPVGTATVPMPAHVSDWWLADIGKDRLGRLLTEKDVRIMVYRVDERLRPHLDPDDLEEGEPVYHLGDWGYVRAKDYEAAFEGEPEWACDMYMLDGNEPGNDGRWADVYNRGGVKALGEELDRMFDEDRADSVYYTTAEAPSEGFTLADPADPVNIAIAGTGGNGVTL